MTRKTKTETGSPFFPDEEDAPWARTKLQAFNAGLRLVSLFAKLFLTLYMGRYLSLSEMGVYGLVFGTVMVLMIVLGQRIDYIVTREIVGASPLTVICKIRDQTVLYLINYFILGLIILALILTRATEVSAKNLVYIFLLSSLEGCAAMLYGNMNSLNRQVLANVQLFLRTGLWVVPVVVMGLIDPGFRTVDAVLNGWALGVISSYAVVAWTWRGMPWREALNKPVDWAWMWSGLKKTSLIWVGAIGLWSGVYVDRFIVLHFLGLDDVGILTFYASFNNSMIALLQSGVAAFAYPRLILFHREGRKDHFHKEAYRTAGQIAMSAAFIAVGLGVAVPLLGRYLNHPVYVEYAPVFWLMLAGTWLRANADTLYMVLFARHQDRAIWLGNLLFLIPAFGCNALFVPFAGLAGIGYGAIAAAGFLFFWRLWHVYLPPSKRR
jgi:O-antigen/teichoic acid export membrane protein